jgi:RHS repeat-associated protein
VTHYLNDTVNGINWQQQTTNYTYDIIGNVKTAVDYRGVEHTFGYNDDGANLYAFPTSITSYTGLNGSGTALTAKATYNYYIGKPSSTIDVNGNPTTYSYSDPFDRLVQVQRPDNGSTAYTYVDNPSAFTVSSAVAQSSGTPISITTSYDGLGRKTCTQDIHSTATTTYAYDSRSRLSCASLPFYGSCSAGCTGSNGTTTTYDGMNRPIQVTEAPNVANGANAVTNTWYGPAATAAGTPSFQTLVQDPANFWKRSATDAFGRLIEVQENPTSGPGVSSAGNGTATYTTTYGYDVLDDLTGVTQTDQAAGQLLRSFTYDTLKRLVKAINPESGTIQYTYDASGNLSVRKDSVRSANLTYDGMNRIMGKTYTDGITPPVTYTYNDTATTCNLKGRLNTVSTLAASATINGTSWSAPAITNTYSCYDTMGRVWNSSQQIGANTYSFGYTYDISGALASTIYPSSVSYPSGRTVTNQFDSSGRIVAVSGLASGVTTQYASNVQYAPQGPIQSLNLANGALTENWGFNLREQPSGLTFSVTGATTPLMTLGWAYGPSANDNGNILSHTIARSSGLASSLTQTFSYTDPANRLTSASESGGWLQNYAYDAFGNRVVNPSSYLPNAGFTPQGSTPAGQFPNNQWIRGTAAPSCSSTVSGSYGDQYDCAGNQIALAMASSPYNQPGSTFAYDGENRLITADVANTSTANFVYDGEGRRVEKITPAATITYVHDAKGDLATEVSTATDTAAGTQYLSVDHLGSTRLVVDASGTPQRCSDYLPFGEEIPFGQNGRSGCYETLASPEYPSAADVVNQKFTGKERDAETGLDYFDARYFSAAQGRFTTSDWSGVPQPVPYANLSDPQTLNLYGYVRNNPLSRADADGHQPPEEEAESEPRERAEEDREIERAEARSRESDEAARSERERDAEAKLSRTFTPEQRAKLRYESEAAMAKLGIGPKACLNEPEVSVTSGGRSSRSDRTASDPLRRDANGKAVPDPEASGAAHTQLGTRQSKSQPGTEYKQAREFDANGKPVKDIDFTNHGRSDHSNPHQHSYDPATGQRGRKEPLQP